VQGDFFIDGEGPQGYKINKSFFSPALWTGQTGNSGEAPWLIAQVHHRQRSLHKRHRPAIPGTIRDCSSAASLANGVLVMN